MHFANCAALAALIKLFFSKSVPIAAKFKPLKINWRENRTQKFLQHFHAIYPPI